MAVINNLYVIKLGSSTIVNNPTIFAEIAALSGRGAKILLVGGGAEAIEQKFAELNEPLKFLELENGDQARYCPPADMSKIMQAYEDYILAPIRQALQGYGLSVFAQVAGTHGWVQGKQGKPLKVRKDGKKLIVRDSLYGSYTTTRHELLLQLLQAYDVVCVTPPIYDESIAQYINIDADMLAAHLAVATRASHMRFVTGTAGVLRDVNDAGSTIADIYPQQEQIGVSGRMKQKLRAAELVLAQGVADIAITGPHTLHGTGKTWFWRGIDVPEDMQLLHQAISIASVSGDEKVLAEFLRDRVRSEQIATTIDAAGNIVCSKGEGAHTLLLLGHMDTVPYLWRSTADATQLAGRGSVDAKGSLINFIEVLNKLDVPPRFRVLVIGAVEEEISSSAGAFYVRDHVQADAVIIGEPSGTTHLTLGYYGLFKLQLDVRQKQQHSAGKDSISPIDRIYQLAAQLRQQMTAYDPDHVSALIELHSGIDSGDHYASAVLNFRISPQAKPGYHEALAELESPHSRITILRHTPGYQNSRRDELVKSFVRGASTVLPDRLILQMKKGTSDMNTLATTWTTIPMVAYGPGDASLDHTDAEYVDVDEVRLSRQVLLNSIQTWFSLTSKEEVYALNGEQVT
ncbi:M20/M25/M40 family metallo-hydrolase [Paenibacillus campi]|uniref:M20/M25/M40 family metallo-hydrolase n=1 Tax=Paenibacillus campi TaxID=3106031 RepID=UPI002AFFA39A|nr:M20/M25/M40 family metallo-hydrolase [Paenibacillus sp. SGZ-1014]